jgi:putative ABC transport system permease protein
METPLLKGRAFTERDTQGSPGVAIISEATARAFFPGEDPIGQVLQASLQIYTDPRAALDRPRQIVGIVGDTRQLWQRNGEREPLPIIPVVYVPYRQHLWEYPGNTAGFHVGAELVIRTASDPMRSVAAIREVVADVDRDVELAQMVTMEERLGDVTTSERFWVGLLGIFAALSVFLAAVGIYGVISYSVVRRRHEFGLRKALGADSVNVIRLVLKESLVLSLIGVGIGLAAAFGLTRLISSQLYGVSATDPLTFSIVSVGLVAIALLASYVPARRAVRTDPMEALRAE